jgi:hypothetical protein
MIHECRSYYKFIACIIVHLGEKENQLLFTQRLRIFERSWAMEVRGLTLRRVIVADNNHETANSTQFIVILYF